MKERWLLAAGLLAALPGVAAGAEERVTSFPPSVETRPWTEVLKKYVDPQGLVAYQRWKQDAADRKRLAQFLDAYAPAGGAPSAEEKIALLANAYNAFIIQTVLDHYPVDSIQSIAGAFTARTHEIGARKYSLDEIEHTAVALGGYRVHASMVCASRSCPPLRREAWSGATLDRDLDAQMRVWMSRADLYRFEPSRHRVRLPMYFVWYRSDFEKEGIARVLARYAPVGDREWLARGKFEIEYLPYNWGLNDQGGEGKGYSGWNRVGSFLRAHPSAAVAGAAGIVLVAWAIRAARKAPRRSS
jgi:Protein of unknown function, DUF547